MNSVTLSAAAETIVSYKLGIGNVTFGCGAPLPYGGSYLEVLPSAYIDNQEPPCFGVPQFASDVCVFSLNNGCEWDFYVVKTSSLRSCFAGEACVSLPLIEPISLHTRIGGLKQAVDLACAI